MKESKFSQNRAIDIKRRHIVNEIKGIPTLVKQGAPAHQQQTGYLILMPGCLINEFIITRKLEGGNTFIAICAAAWRRNGD